jgi:hypothetical protein
MQGYTKLAISSTCKYCSYTIAGMECLKASENSGSTQLTLLQHQVADQLQTPVYNCKPGLLNCANSVCVRVCVSVMTYVCQQPRSAAPHTPRVILIGPPGCGRSTMAATVAAKYRLVNGQFHIRPVVLQQHCYSAEQPLELIGGDVLLLVSFVLCTVVPSITCATASIQQQQQ